MIRAASICLAALALFQIGCRSAPSQESAYADILAKSRHGQISQALQEADTEFRRYETKQPEQAWRFRVLEAQLLVVQGKPKDALDLLDAEPPASMATSEVAARRKMVQGLALGFTQQFGPAEHDLQEAEDLARPLGSDLLVEVLLSRGTVDVNEANYGEAEKRFRQALEIARQRNNVPSQSRALGSLGNVAMWQEHYDEAVDRYKDSLQASQSSGATDASATTLGNIGWSYYAMGDFESALSYFRQAEGAAVKSGLQRGEVEWLMDIGNVYSGQRDFHSAEATYQQALATAKSIGFDSAVAECLDNLAQNDLDTGQLNSARARSDEAIALMGDKRDHFLAPYSLLIKARVAENSKNYEEAQRLFKSVVNDQSAGTALHWEADARLAKTLAEAKKPKRAEQEFRNSINTIEAARASVQTESFRLSFLSSAIEFYSDYIDFLVAQGRTNDALEVAELGRAHTLLASANSNSSGFSLPIKGFRPMDTARRMHTVFLCYWLGNQNSYLWVVTPSQMKIFTLPSQAKLDPPIQAYRREMAGPLDPLSAKNQNGQSLYDALIAPAKAFIPKGSSVTILPDGSLYDLNFEALLCPEPALHYWIDDVVVEYANSLVMLAGAGNEKRAAAPTLLLIGNPVSPSPEFPDLPQAPAEIQQVEDHFPSVDRKVFSGSSATASAFLASDAGQYSFIHFVAHGTASRASPLDSAVILSKDGDSYKLYARDIVKQRLRANLVTISACHGAGSRTYSGEGMVGLTWAFLRAGAHGVIAALWDVNDAYTAQLMGHLYDGMSKGAPPDVALRNAKLAAVHGGLPYSKPFYWAAFQVYRGS